MATSRRKKDVTATKATTATTKTTKKDKDVTEVAQVILGKLEDIEKSILNMDKKLKVLEDRTEQFDGDFEELFQILEELEMEE